MNRCFSGRKIEEIKQKYTTNKVLILFFRQPLYIHEWLSICLRVYYSTTPINCELTTALYDSTVTERGEE